MIDILLKDTVFQTRKDEEKNVLDEGPKFDELKIDNFHPLRSIVLVIISDHHVVYPKVSVAE